MLQFSHWQSAASRLHTTGPQPLRVHDLRAHACPPRSASMRSMRGTLQLLFLASALLAAVCSPIPAAAAPAHDQHILESFSAAELLHGPGDSGWGAPALSGALDTDVSPARNLLTSGGWGLPMCPLCKILACEGNWWFGKCKKMGYVYPCWRPKAQFFMFRAAVNGTAPGDRLKSAAAGAPPALSLVPQNLTATAPFVACLSDADCSLPADDFAAVNSSAPIATGGRLAGRCRRPALVDDPSGNFTDFPGICDCTYVSSSAPAGVRDLLTSCDRARDVVLGFNASDTEFSINSTPFFSLVAVDVCLQRGDFPGPGGQPPRAFFVPGDGPYPITREEDAPIPPSVRPVTDPALYTFGSIIEDAFIDGLPKDGGGSDADPPDDVEFPCPRNGTCARDNRQCAGLGAEFEVAKACCGEEYLCVRRDDRFAQCRLNGTPGLVNWEGSILPCGTPRDANVSTPAV